MIKNCIEKLSNTKVLDTFSLKKAIAFFKENTRTDDNTRTIRVCHSFIFFETSIVFPLYFTEISVL
ncbi:hypothetical protein PMI10_01711 [Flavobacterium sp. CF136]|nr:hypothetical protein PMI10_01711 [Flavobacterium sp. CF136]